VDDPAPVLVVEISVSPGHVGITAPSRDAAWFVREAIPAAGGSYGSARQGGRVADLIVDLGAALSAKLGCQALARLGVRFRWHMDQDPAVRAGSWESELPGL
jgi:hypothetical protein